MLNVILNIKNIRLYITIFVFILLIILPVILSNYTTILLTSILFYIILTVGWVMFSGPTGYISLAPAAFIGVGIYTTALLGEKLPFPVVLIIAGIVSIILAILVGSLTLRLKGIYFTVFTFGLVELIRNLVLYIEIHLIGTFGRTVISMNFLSVYFYMLAIFAVLLVTYFLIKLSRYGFALKCIGNNEKAAAHVGINVTLLKIMTFAASSFFMGVAGSVWSVKLGYINSNIAFNMFFSFMPVLMAVFGGTSQLYGPVIGSAIFTYMEELLLTKLPELFMLTFGIIMVVAILFMPDGLVGVIQKLIKKQLGGNRANS